MRRQATPDALLLDVNTVAEQLSVCPLSVRQAIKAGELRAVRFGRRVLVPREALAEFIAANVILTPEAV